MTEEAKPKTLAERLRAQNIVEIELPGETETLKFRKLAGFDFVAAELLPVDVYLKSMTEEQREAAAKRHIDMMIKSPRALQLYEHGIATVLIRTAIEPEIVADAKAVTDKAKQIAVTELGPIAEFIFNQLLEKSGLGKEAEAIASFRSRKERELSGRGGKTLRHPALRAVKK
jgi:acetolactate synthase regulatory subunit